jgi:hypothetical protein
MWQFPRAAVLSSGETVPARTFTVESIPDTLFGGRPLEIEMVFDLSGLFYWEYGVADTYLRLNSRFIRTRQVR